MEVEGLQNGIQNLSIGNLPSVNSHLKIKRNFEKKAILKQKLREGQKQKLR
jgi:hypothetical protein